MYSGWSCVFDAFVHVQPASLVQYVCPSLPPLACTPPSASVDELEQLAEEMQSTKAELNDAKYVCVIQTVVLLDCPLLLVVQGGCSIPLAAGLTPRLCSGIVQVLSVTSGG